MSRGIPVVLQEHDTLAAQVIRDIVVDQLGATIQLAEAARAKAKEEALQPVEDQLATELRAYFLWATGRIADQLGQQPAIAEADSTVTGRDLDVLWGEVERLGDEILLNAVNEPMLTAATMGSADMLGDMGWAVSFNLPNANANKFMREYGAELVKNVSGTLRDALNATLEHGIVTGQSSEKIADMIRQLGIQFSTPKPQQHIKDRAHLIAVTELAKAYEQGSWMTADRLYRNGVELEKRWISVNDGRVDPLCEQAVRVEWVPRGFRYGRALLEMPPMHPACRCTVVWRWKKPKGEQSPLDWQPVKAGRTSWRDWMDETVATKLPAFRMGMVSRGDTVLANIAAKLGFDKLPNRISSAQAQILAKKGWTEFHRGMDGGKSESVRYADRLRSGEYYAGNGIWGKGTYAAAGKEVFKRDDWTSDEYKRFDAPDAAANVARGFAGQDGQVVRGFLDPKARIVNWTQLETEWHNAVADWQNEQGLSISLPPRANRGTAPTGEELLVDAPIGWYRVPNVLQDPGRFAASQGYDAIYIPRSDRVGHSELGDQYVILNRTIMHVVD
jgi:hypothetical protein